MDNTTPLKIMSPLAVKLRTRYKAKRSQVEKVAYNWKAPFEVPDLEDPAPSTSIFASIGDAFEDIGDALDDARSASRTALS